MGPCELDLLTPMWFSQHTLCTIVTMQEVVLRAFVYAGERRGLFHHLLVKVPSSSHVEDVFEAFEAKLKSKSDYDNWRVSSV